MAYSLSVLSLEPVVNDSVGGIPVLVLFGQNRVTTAVFDRTVGDQVLTFSLSDPAALTLTDAETSGTWDGLAGLATSGPLSARS